MKCKDCKAFFKCQACKKRLKWLKCVTCQECTECQKCTMHQGCIKCNKLAKCSKCKGGKETETPNFTECVDCLALQMCYDCKECKDCDLCTKCCDCTDCARLRSSIPDMNCTKCNSIKEKIGVRNAQVFCISDNREICSMCAAKYHKKCKEMYDTYDLVVEAGKLIDKELENLTKQKSKETTTGEIIGEEQLEEYVNLINYDNGLFKEKKEKIEEKMIVMIQDKFKVIEQNYLQLRQELEKLKKNLELANQSREEKKIKLEEIRLFLDGKVCDEDFLAVLSKYRELKNMQDSHSPILNKNIAKKVYDKVSNFKNNPLLQTLERNTKNIFTATKQESGGFQRCKNRVFLLSPYSSQMYTYDLDKHKSSCKELMDENQNQFRMKYSGSTLYHDNRVFIIGGSESMGHCAKNCWEYSFLHKFLKPMEDMIISRREHSTIFASGYIYCVGGSSNDQLTNRCEKILVERNGKNTKESWVEIRKLNSEKSAISLCTFATQDVIYAIGGITKDHTASYFERLMIVADGLGEESTNQQNFWEKIAVTCSDFFIPENPFVGSFTFAKDGSQYILIFTGAEKEENSLSYLCDLSNKSLTKFLCPKISGSGSLHDRKPVYTNNGEDIYFVGFYDILHFNTKEMQWLTPIGTALWIS